MTQVAPITARLTLSSLSTGISKAVGPAYGVMPRRTSTAAMKICRCPWAESYQGAIREMYLKYHDEEWGVPVRGDDRQVNLDYGDIDDIDCMCV